MSIYEYDEEAVKKVWQDEAFAEGKQEGVALGRQEGVVLGRQEGVVLGRQEGTALMNQLHECLLNTGRIDDLKRSFTDDEFCNQLLQEFGLLSEHQ